MQSISNSISRGSLANGSEQEDPTIFILRRKMKSSTTNNVSVGRDKQKNCDSLILDASTTLDITIQPRYKSKYGMCEGGNIVHRIVVKDGSYHVGWLVDRFAKRCMNCERGFGFTRRRHHCRKCGNIFCNICSTSRLPVVGLNESEGPTFLTHRYIHTHFYTTHQYTNS